MLYLVVFAYRKEKLNYQNYNCSVIVAAQHMHVLQKLVGCFFTFTERVE